ncbi:hypothetical protein DWU95_45125, partial [Burkholderia contaminans]
RSDLSTAQNTIATHTTQIDTINNQLNELSDGTIGLLQQSTAGRDPHRRHAHQSPRPQHHPTPAP